MSLKKTNHTGLYIDSPVWMENRKATKNTINKKSNKCFFQYTVTVLLNHEENKKNPERIIKN